MHLSTPGNGLLNPEVDYTYIDCAGPLLGYTCMYLIIVDAYSKWLAVEVMHSITAEKTIHKLRTIFATHGTPHKIVTDNGPTITDVTGPLSYKIKLTDGTIVHRHVDSIKQRHDTTVTVTSKVAPEFEGPIILTLRLKKLDNRN